LSGASPRWKIERMAAVDRNVLYLGVYELIEGETPAPVVINEAVELAKKYGAEQSAAFVNGILDEIRRTIEQESKK
jgi:N utilization substance protein B